MNLVAQRGVGDFTFTWNVVPEDWRKIFPCAVGTCDRQPVDRLTLWRGGLQLMSVVLCADHRAEVREHEMEFSYSWSEANGFRVWR